MPSDRWYAKLSGMLLTGLQKTAAVVERFLLIWLCIASGIAFGWPTRLEFDPFVDTADWVPYGFAVTMFAIGWLLHVNEVQEVFRRWPLVLCGTTLQYLSMPLIAYLIANSFPLSDAWKLGIMMAGCVPGAMASNVLTMIARGNVSYSLCLTTTATLLSPICVPIALKLGMSESFEVPVEGIVVKLCWMVVGPVIGGFLVGLLFDFFNRRVRDWAQPIGKIVANLTILWIIAVVVSANRERVTSIDASLLMAILTLNLGGYGVGQVGARLFRLPSSMGRALTLEIGMQNAGLGVTLAMEIFGKESPVLIPVAIYTFGCMFTGTILARYWSSRPTELAAPPESPPE
ncbi:MAG: bile acid:sodium symporter family protein [Pirellulaceae bacterium]|nr:bile acid:sodium symporter family protein [Pirellulaceae bacterium]